MVATQVDDSGVCGLTRTHRREPLSYRGFPAESHQFRAPGPGRSAVANVGDESTIPKALRADGVITHPVGHR